MNGSTVGENVLYDTQADPYEIRNLATTLKSLALAEELEATSEQEKQS